MPGRAQRTYLFEHPCTLLRKPGSSRSLDPSSSASAPLQCNWLWQPHTWQQWGRWQGSFVHHCAVLQRRVGWGAQYRRTGVTSSHWFVVWKGVRTNLSHLSLSHWIAMTAGQIYQEISRESLTLCSVAYSPKKKKTIGSRNCTHICEGLGFLSSGELMCYSWSACILHPVQNKAPLSGTGEGGDCTGSNTTSLNDAFLDSPTGVN